MNLFDLRFIRRDGKNILQFRTGWQNHLHTEYMVIGRRFNNEKQWGDWQDVPLIDEFQSQQPAVVRAESESTNS